MTKRIKVKVIHRKSRGRFALRFPGGERLAKSNSVAGAYREAMNLEADLNSRIEVVDWRTACESYERMHLEDLSDDHQKTWRVVRRRFERFFSGDMPTLADFNNAMLGAFAHELSENMTTTSVRSYCRYVRGFFRWCEHQEWIAKAPQFRLKRRKHRERRSRGRPLTGEEFDRMLAKIPSIVGDECAASWVHLCRGLWESSLRLTEATKLHWSNGPVKINASDKLIEFPDGDKGGHVALPITKEFWELIGHRRKIGHVFKPRVTGGVSRAKATWGKKIASFGKAAGIIVKRDGDKVKYASAHDLRRSFMQNWAGKVSLETLQILARHGSIDTTQKYYLGDQATRVAAEIWRDLPEIE